MEFVVEQSVLILYSGETGNAEEVAYDVFAKLRKPSRIMCIREFDVLDLPTEHFIIFVVSTTGDGDVPETMKSFWTFLLRKGLPSTALSDLKYALFGLGDTAYEKYNAVARKLDKRLKMLGAKEVVPLGYGDDQAPFGYFTAYNSWIAALCTYMGIVLTVTDDVSERNSRYSVEEVGSFCDSMDVSLKSPNSRREVVYAVEVLENKRLTASVWGQDVRHIKLCLLSELNDLNQTKSFYQCGDVAVVHYSNPIELVQQAAAIIAEGCRIHGYPEYTLDTVLNIECSNPEGVSHRPSRLSSISDCTLKLLLERHLDIAAVPKRSYFSALAPYATNPEESAKLLELSSPEGTDLYFDYCIKERKSYLEVLQEFRSCRPPFPVLLETIQAIPPRQYSIASSPHINPNEVPVVVWYLYLLIVCIYGILLIRVTRCFCCCVVGIMCRCVRAPHALWTEAHRPLLWIPLSSQHWGYSVGVYPPWCDPQYCITASWWYWRGCQLHIYFHQCTATNSSGTWYWCCTNACTAAA